MEGLDTGVLEGFTHPSYSRAAPSDGNGGLPPTFSPHRSQPAPWQGHSSQGGGGPTALDPTLVGRWKPRAPLPALPTALPGRWAWGQEIPWDKGSWVRDSRARGHSWESMRWLGTPRDPLLPHSSPHLSITDGLHTAISEAGTLMGVGAGPRARFSSRLMVHGHGDRIETRQGSQRRLSPAARMSPEMSVTRGDQQPSPMTEHCHLLGTAGTGAHPRMETAMGTGPSTGSSGSLAPLSPRRHRRTTIKKLSVMDPGMVTATV